MHSNPLVKPIRLWPNGSEHSRRVTWLELFFDLIFVAAVSQVAAALARDYSIHGLVRFAFMFLLIWWAWLGHTMYSTRFDADDAVQRLLTLVQIFAAAAMAANAKDSFDSRDSAGFGAAYAVLRIVLVVQYLRARRLRQTRHLTSLYAAGFGVAALLWGLAAIVESPARFWIWGVALMVDLTTPWLAMSHSHKVPHGADHLPERFGLFTIILLGESVAAVMHGMESQENWPLSAAISAFLGMALAFGYWWWYFDGVHGASERHVRSKKDISRFHLWSYAHFPLYLAIAVTGVGIEHIVSLAPGEHLHHAAVWILVSAAFVLMTSLITIGVTHETAPARRSLLGRYALAATVLPAGFLADTLLPCIFIVGLTLLCALQVGWAISGHSLLTRNKMRREPRADFSAALGREVVQREV
jgi:low temperature requirement protein LtrA